jgi:hypothetical protein
VLLISVNLVVFQSSKRISYIFGLSTYIFIKRTKSVSYSFCNGVLITPSVSLNVNTVPCCETAYLFRTTYISEFFAGLKIGCKMLNLP